MKMKMKKPASGMVESKTIGSVVADVILGVILILVAFCCIAPMWHVLMSSMSDGLQLFGNEGLIVLPLGGVNWGGYKLLFRDDAIIRSFFVTIFYVVGTCLYGLVLNVTGGYVLSQPSKLRGLFMGLLVFTMMFSGGLIPSYMVNKSIGLVGSPLAVILPGCTNAMFIIMLMNSYLQVPQSTVEAARIDGAGHISVMFQVMLPQAKGMALVTVINTALGAWNDWFTASIYLVKQRDWWPLQLVIKDLVARNQDFLQTANPNFDRFLIQYVAIVVATLPVILLMPLFIKKLEDNMVLGAVKG